QHCHSEPVRTLVWESPSNFRKLFVIQNALLYRFPEYACMLSKNGASTREIATKVVRYFIAMTGNSGSQ
ncbi:MAG: hypothetical protein ACI4P4_13375, partial [Faecousia sp.]